MNIVLQSINLKSDFLIDFLTFEWDKLILSFSEFASSGAVFKKFHHLNII
ncbi:hypothetical protein KAW48_04110 [candidate division WOR-3 bacterium]|nr:hypothetical protein [candidate division WOR-3 bacterium]